MKTLAIVLSAGVGKRMNSDIPKQYLKINEREIIYYTLKAFENSKVDEIMVVAGENDIEFLQNQIVDKYNFKKVAKVVSGGDERYESVYNGLISAQGADFVLIHDGARPCIKSNDINEIIECVEKNEACIMAVRAKDTIKVVIEHIIVDSPDRNTLWQAQTPQAFRYDKIKESYMKLIKENKNELRNITDDASVWSKYQDEPVVIYEGDYKNIKITTVEDLENIKTYLD